MNAVSSTLPKNLKRVEVNSAIAFCRNCGNTASNEELLKKLCIKPDKCPLA